MLLLPRADRAVTSLSQSMPGSTASNVADSASKNKAGTPDRKDGNCYHTGTCSACGDDDESKAKSVARHWPF